MSDGNQPHYFSEQSGPRLDPAELQWRQVSLAGMEFVVATASGVFSASKVDLGTQVLLRTVACGDPGLPNSGTLVDLGSGWGALGLVMAKMAPQADVWAVDANPRALQLTKINAERAGIGNLTIATPDQASRLQPDVIWSNPPIRIGKAALHQLLSDWLNRLAPQGHADLVVQRHLGADSLARWLSAGGHSTQRLASAKGYRVLRVTNC